MMNERESQDQIGFAARGEVHPLGEPPADVRARIGGVDDKGQDVRHAIVAKPLVMQIGDVVVGVECQHVAAVARRDTAEGAGVGADVPDEIALDTAGNVFDEPNFLRKILVFVAVCLLVVVPDTALRRRREGLDRPAQSLDQSGNRRRGEHRIRGDVGFALGLE